MIRVLRYRYALTVDGKRRCTANDGKGEFFGQSWKSYKGYTEKIFRVLFPDESLTIREISERTGIHKRSVNGVMTYNIMAGFIRKITL